MSIRDHGGDLARARARWGGGEGWIDLSTGINRQPWPVPHLPPEIWTALPERGLQARTEAAAASAYGAGGGVLALAGAQAAIQLYPGLLKPGVAAVLSPTYNEHAAALAAQGWQVRPSDTLGGLAGVDLAVVVNPNNPDGRSFAPDLLEGLAAQVGLLVVDESFADPTPELSLAGTGRGNILVLRSFGKFFGLAGVRLGFALGPQHTLATMAERAGPWAVSGPALTIGAAALADTAWISATRARLTAESQRLDAMAAPAGWQLLGGTALFRTYRTPDAAAAQETLARARIWTRRFPYSDTWLRLGLPGTEGEWARLQATLDAAL